MDLSVRRAGSNDLDAASAVLAEAFADYPWTRWTVDTDDHVDRIRRLQRMVLEHIALPYGEVWVATDRSGEVMSVAVWSPSSAEVPTAVLEMLEAERAELEGGRANASMAAEAAVAHLRPGADHYVLGAVGTARAYRHRGVGTAVLMPLLDRAASESIDVHLETSTANNVAFYRRLGFEVFGHVRVPNGGPDVWAMVRRGSDEPGSGAPRT